jgi:hypothetical protein
MEAGRHRRVPRRPGGGGLVATVGPKAIATLDASVQAEAVEGGAAADQCGGAVAASARGMGQDLNRVCLEREGQGHAGCLFR